MKMYKRIFGVLLCLCMLLGAVSLASAEEDGATGSGAETGGNTGHSHALCYGTGTACTDPNHDSHSDVSFDKKLSQGEDGTLYIDESKWEYVDNIGYVLPAGTYYLGTDLTLDYKIRISNSGGVKVTLCLNGKTITCKEAGAAIGAPAIVAAVFTLCDCQPDGSEGKITHETGIRGTGIEIGGSSGKADRFIMYNGCITGNSTGTGAGVQLNPKTNFTMYGGRIIENRTDSGAGGGVYMASEASFTMYGGTIADNYASMCGGGVYVAGASGETYGAGNFTMYGGSITGNHTAGDGGGIYSGNANLTIYGGSVTGNSAERNGGAVYVDGTMIVGGDINISGNWKGDAQSSASNDNANNVYLSEYGNNGSSDGPATIAIEEPLTGRGSIGITTKTSVATTRDASIKIAAGKGTHAITDADKGHFTPDTGYCEVQKKDDGALYLTHVHSGGTATCTKGATCGGCGSVYTDKDTTNHTGTLGEWKTDNTNHWKEYSCCKTKVDVTEHTYNQEAVNPIYLKTEATCKQYSVYYKSCICGAKGTDTFEDVNGGKNPAIHAGTPGAGWTGADGTKHWKQWSCCGAQVSGTDEAHNGTKWTVGEVTTSATCTTTGVRTYTCEDCGYTKTETIPANGHDFENGTYVYDDTQHWKKCAKCDAEDTDHKTKHTEVIDKAKPATTTETGLTEGKHCDVCGKVLVAQEVTPKLTPRYYYNSTTTTTKDTTKKDNTKSPGTFDPGVGVYALTAVLSVTGMAWVGRKKH